MADSDYPGPDQPSLPDPREIDRRTALKALGGAAAIGVVAPAFAVPPASPLRSTALVGPARRALVPDARAVRFHFQAVRVEDMFYLDFEFYNCHRIVRNRQTYVVKLTQTLPAIMVAIFQPQHIGEESIPFTEGMTTWKVPPLHGALAGNSWLAFEIPDRAEIPLTIAGLLAWTRLTPQLVPVVQNPSKGFPGAPDVLHSALEVPWSLWLSPPAGGTWHHAVAPVTSGGRTELWHTRLGVQGVEPPQATPQLKAFWSRDYLKGIFGVFPPDPFPNMSLIPQYRFDIVNLTTRVRPASAKFFALSPLGASINVEGSWPNNPISSLQSWVHRTSLGRDSYVRVVRLGYLFPFGVRAVRIEITEREFQVDLNGDVVAYLVTKKFIVVTQPVITYAGDPHEPFAGRRNPIRQVKVKTVSTPPIDFDQIGDPGIRVPFFDPGSVLWVRSGNTDVPFTFTVTDIEGRSVDTTTSVIWLDETITDSNSIGFIALGYDTADPSRNSPSFGGSLFAFADTNGAPVGSTAHHVDTYTLTAKYAANGAANFYPMLKSAAIRLPGAEQLAGAGSTSLPSPTVSIHDHYGDNGFQPGVTEVYLAVNNAPALSFPVNLVGGMAAPNFDISGIARDIGPVGGDPATLLGGTFDPDNYFSVLSGGIGKLLGAIAINEIIQKIKVNSAAANAQAPHISSTFIYPNNDKTKPPAALLTKLKWQPKVQGDTAGLFKPNNSKLLITAEIMVPISQPSQTTYKVHGELNNFELLLFGSSTSFIGITFSSLTFDSSTGSKTSVQPKINSVTFLDQLSFIQDLEQLLASIGGPSIDVTAAGINTSYSLALPSVGVGVFSLSNLSINAGLNIPFDGSPVRVRFGLSTADNPFLLTVWIFGGGGYFSLAIGADGIEEIQVQLEFGAAVSIDLGVASGGVSIMAGIYYSLQTAPTKQVMLTGFLRADGNLSVLGIITLSVEFYLGLTYLDPGQAFGEATVTLSISVLFFSASVDATMRKTLGGGQGQSASAAMPNALSIEKPHDFKAAISVADWDTYCEAYAV